MNNYMLIDDSGFEESHDSKENDLMMMLKDQETKFSIEREALKDEIRAATSRLSTAKAAIDELQTCKHQIEHSKKCDVCSAFHGKRNMWYIIIIVILLTLVAVLIIKKRSEL